MDGNIRKTKVLDRKVRLLPDFIANQIAAGEVVQRPESVVKELVENSLDAGADTVFVTVKDAGKQLIHIVDNGSGMNRDDLEMSVKRHATSKIFSQEDLEEIKTFGFRGEALASIASVSLLEIRTMQKDDTYGWKLISEPGKEPRIEAASLDTGTQIFVRNLFFNVPARRKFLKTNITEFRYLSDAMIKFSLGNPDKRFIFYDDETLIFDAKPSELKYRIDTVIGGNIKDKLIPVEYSNEYIKITGYLGDTSLARETRPSQYFFLNSRSILSGALAHAIYSAFEPILEKNKKPFFVLNLSLDYKNVDVNVHPQKHEVKFEDERFVYNSLKNAALEALNRHHAIPELHTERITAFNPMERFRGNDETFLVNKTTGEIIETTHNTRHEKPTHNFNQPFETKREYFSEKSRDLLYGNISSEYNQPLIDNSSFEENDDTNFIYFGGKFAAVPGKDGLVIINLRRAKEKILFEQFNPQNKDRQPSSQKLLFPVSLAVETHQHSIFLEIKTALEQTGFEFDISDTGTIELIGVPIEITEGNELELIYKLLEKYESEKHDAIDITKFVTSFTSRSIALNKSLFDKSEIASIIKLLRKTKNPAYLEDGRRIYITRTSDEVGKMLD